MKKIYIEANMGVAGDMLCASLLDTLNLEEQNKIIEKLSTFMDGVFVEISKTTKCGISGTHFDVKIKKDEHYHSHNSIKEIYSIIDSFDVNDKVKENAKGIYTLLAQAESKVHGVDVADIHLHEVGAKDAIMDITAFCYIMDVMGIDALECSPIVTGFGQVKTAHGILPVPAPATAELLKGIQCKAGDIEGELTTPTGAAIIKYFANQIGTNDGAYHSIGYGMGKKDFEKPNCIRAFLSENDEKEIVELRCQIDDMTGEEMGYAVTKLMSLGALDAFVTPIIMKKSRPAFALTVITKPCKKDYFVEQMFKHTTTLGVRIVSCLRKEMEREIIEKNSIHIKRSVGYGTEKAKIEFDDIAKHADEKDISIFEARKEIEKEL